MSDFENVLIRATAAVAAGIAEVSVTEKPTVLDTRYYADKVEPAVTTTGIHSVKITIEWVEPQP